MIRTRVPNYKYLNITGGHCLLPLKKTRSLRDITIESAQSWFTETRNSQGVVRVFSFSKNYGRLVIITLKKLTSTIRSVLFNVSCNFSS